VEEPLLEEPLDSDPYARGPDFSPGPDDEALFDDPTPAVDTSSEAAPLALYRRYRPDTFADVIGQEHVTEPLQRALANNRVKHA